MTNTPTVNRDRVRATLTPEETALERAAWNALTARLDAEEAMKAARLALRRARATERKAEKAWRQHPKGREYQAAILADCALARPMPIAI